MYCYCLRMWFILESDVKWKTGGKSENIIKKSGQFTNWGPSTERTAVSYRHWYKHQYCCIVDCILQILFSSYSISLLFNQSLIVKIKKHFNQFIMSLLFCVILFYRIFLVSAAASVGTEQMSTGHLVPLYFTLSEFVNLYGKI